VLAFIDFVDYNDSTYNHKDLSMAILTVRNLDDSIKAKLRLVAAEHGQSMEEEVRQILKCALSNENQDKGLGSRINQHFTEVGCVSLPLRKRSLPRSAPDFSEINR
jgi:plasmid stability protein